MHNVILHPVILLIIIKCCNNNGEVENIYSIIMATLFAIIMLLTCRTIYVSLWFMTSAYA